jgi:hypothetical protein
MGILYGAFLYTLVPELWAWSRLPLGLALIDRGLVSWILTVFALGVAGSGLRDLRASYAPRTALA